jgi:hypothetical protein
MYIGHLDGPVRHSSNPSLEMPQIVQRAPRNNLTATDSILPLVVCTRIHTYTT